jgi:hypothetical protein
VSDVGLGFQGGANTGFYRNSNLYVALAGLSVAVWRTTAFQVDGGDMIGWSSGSTALSIDAAIARAGVGVTKFVASNSLTKGGTFSSPANSQAAFTGNQNDLVLTDPSHFQRWTTDDLGSRNVTGIAAGVDGQQLTIVNVGTTDSIVLKHQDAGSAAANRFLFDTGADITLAANGGSVTIIYDDTTDRWRNKN